MFLNFQTQADIRKIIVETLLAIDKPATTQEVADWIWNRCLIDGLQTGVQRTVNAEIRSMMQEGLLVAAGGPDVETLSAYRFKVKIADLLTAMALLTDE